MSVLSVTCCSLLSAVCAFTLVSATGCNTDAQGIDDCREIEQTRCVAAKNCGLVPDVDACQRYYRDQCLHGLPMTPPGSVKLKQCVDTIRAAGVCATQSGGTDTPLSDCDPELPSAVSNDLVSACDLVQEPEKSVACSFLTPGVEAGVGGASNSGSGSGEAGAGGSSGEEGS